MKPNLNIVMDAPEGKNCYLPYFSILYVRNPDRLVKPICIFIIPAFTTQVINGSCWGLNCQEAFNIYNHVIGSSIPKTTCIQFVKLACIPLARFIKYLNE